MSDNLDFSSMSDEELDRLISENEDVKDEQPEQDIDFSSMSDEELERLISENDEKPTADVAKSVNPQNPPSYGISDKIADTRTAQFGRESDGGIVQELQEAIVPLEHGIREGQYGEEDENRSAFIKGDALKDALERHGEAPDESMEGYKADSFGALEEGARTFGHDVAAQVANIPFFIGSAVKGVRGLARRAYNNKATDVLIDYARDAGFTDEDIELAKEHSQGDPYKMNDFFVRLSKTMVEDTSVARDSASKRVADYSQGEEGVVSKVVTGAVGMAPVIGEFATVGAAGRALGIAAKIAPGMSRARMALEGIKAAGKFSTPVLGAEFSRKRFNELTKDEYAVDESGNLVMRSAGESTGKAAAKAIAGGMAESAIWTIVPAATSPYLASWLKSAAKLVHTNVGRRSAGLYDNFMKLAEVTGIRGYPTMAVQMTGTDFVNNVLGLSIKDEEYNRKDEKSGLAGFARAWDDFNKNTLTLKGQGEIFLSTLGMFALQSTAAFAKSQVAASRSKASDKAMLKTFLTDQTERDPEKRNQNEKRIGELVDAMSPEQAHMWRRLLTQKAWGDEISKKRHEGSAFAFTKEKLDRFADHLSQKFGEKTAKINKRMAEEAMKADNSAGWLEQSLADPRLVRELKQKAANGDAEAMRRLEELADSDSLMEQTYRSRLRFSVPHKTVPKVDKDGKVVGQKEVVAWNDVSLDVDGETVVRQEFTDEKTGISIVKAVQKDPSGGDNGWLYIIGDKNGHTATRYGFKDAYDAALRMEYVGIRQQEARRSKADYIQKLYAARMPGENAEIYDNAADFNRKNASAIEQGTVAPIRDGEQARINRATGKAIYLLDDLDSPQEALRNVLHEVGRHRGLDAIYPDRGSRQKFLSNLAVDDPYTQAQLVRSTDAYNRRMARVAEETGREFKPVDVSEAMKVDEIMDEVWAHTYDTEGVPSEPGWLGQHALKVRDAVRSVAPWLKVSRAEMDAVYRGAMERLAEGSGGEVKYIPELSTEEAAAAAARDADAAKRYNEGRQAEKDARLAGDDFKQFVKGVAEEAQAARQKERDEQKRRNIDADAKRKEAFRVAKDNGHAQREEELAAAFHEGQDEKDRADEKRRMDEADAAAEEARVNQRREDVEEAIATDQEERRGREMMANRVEAQQAKRKAEHEAAEARKKENRKAEEERQQREYDERMLRNEERRVEEHRARIERKRAALKEAEKADHEAKVREAEAAEKKQARLDAANRFVAEEEAIRHRREMEAREVFGQQARDEHRRAAAEHEAEEKARAEREAKEEEERPVIVVGSEERSIEGVKNDEHRADVNGHEVVTVAHRDEGGNVVGYDYFEDRNGNRRFIMSSPKKKSSPEAAFRARRSQLAKKLKPSGERFVPPKPGDGQAVSPSGEFEVGTVEDFYPDQKAVKIGGELFFLDRQDGKLYLSNPEGGKVEAFWRTDENGSPKVFTKEGLARKELSDAGAEVHDDGASFEFENSRYEHFIDDEGTLHLVDADSGDEVIVRNNGKVEEHGKEEAGIVEASRGETLGGPEEGVREAQGVSEEARPEKLIADGVRNEGIDAANDVFARMQARKQGKEAPAPRPKAYTGADPVGDIFSLLKDLHFDEAEVVQTDAERRRYVALGSLAAAIRSLHDNGKVRDFYDFVRIMHERDGRQTTDTIKDLRRVWNFAAHDSDGLREVSEIVASDALKSAQGGRDLRNVAGESVLESMKRLAPEVVMLPAKDLDRSDARLPNMKLDADPRKGIVKPISSEPRSLLSNPIVVMEFNDGVRAVVTGRHRAELYARHDMDIPARILREKDGWTVEKARMVDALSNIQDGKGTIEDYVSFFREAGLSREQAIKEGVVDSANGEAAFHIYADATPDLRASIDYSGRGADGMVSPEQAAIIAKFAPKDGESYNEQIQRNVLDYVLRHPNIGKASLQGRVQDSVSAAKKILSRKGADAFEQGSLFGDDSDFQALVKQEEAARKAVEKKQAEYRDIARMIRSALNSGGNLKLDKRFANELGIRNPKDRKQLASAYERAKIREEDWGRDILRPDDRAELDAMLGIEPSQGKTEIENKLSDPAFRSWAEGQGKNASESMRHYYDRRNGEIFDSVKPESIGEAAKAPVDEGPSLFDAPGANRSFDVNEVTIGVGRAMDRFVKAGNKDFLQFLRGMYGANPELVKKLGGDLVDIWNSVRAKQKSDANFATVDDYNLLAGERGFDRIEAKKPAEAEKEAPEFKQYHPAKFRADGMKASPTKLDESRGLSGVESPDVTYKMDIPEDFIKNGDLFEHQLEAIAYAGQSHEQMNPNGTRKAMLLGHRTGAGKGRMVAGIVLDNWNKGRRNAVWFSVNEGLADSAVRDLTPFGLADKFYDAGDGNGARGPAEGVGYSTYNKLREEGFVENLAKRLGGAAFDGVIAFDEAHMGKTKDGRTQEAMLKLQELLPNARVVYLSATSATEISNLASMAERLGLCGKGTNVPDFETFENRIKNMGVQGMEFVARTLKARGQYLSNGLSTDGVKYEHMSIPTTESQKADYHAYSETMNEVFQNLVAASMSTGLAGTKADPANIFHGWQQRVHNNIISSIKIPTVIEAAKKDLKEGRSPIFSLVYTNEAGTGREVKESIGTDNVLDFDDVNYGAKKLLMEFLTAEHDKTQNGVTFKDYHFRTKYVEDGDDMAKFSHDAEILRKKCIRLVESLPDSFGNPIKMISDALGAENVANLTGLNKTHFMEDLKDFQDGRKKALVFSKKANTGYSFHTDKGFANQDQRKLYVLQPGWRADDYDQTLGRVHRVNQTSLPEYVSVATDIPGESRFFSSVARRKGQLSAFTQGDRAQNGELISEAHNFEDEYSKKAILATIQTFINNGMIDDLARTMNFVGAKKRGNSYDLVNKLVDKDGKAILPGGKTGSFLNRLSLLPMEDQSDVLDMMKHFKKGLIQKEIDEGTYDPGRQDSGATRADELRGVKLADGLEARHVNNWFATNRRTFEQFMDQHPDESFRVVRNKRTGEVFAVRDDNTMSRGGARVPAAVAYGVDGTKKRDVAARFDTSLPNSRYELLPYEEARTAWNNEYGIIPQERAKDSFYVSGDMLEHWDKIAPFISKKVYSINTGEREFIGAFIRPDKLARLFKRFDIGEEGRQMILDGKVREVLNNRAVDLVNGWQLKQVPRNGEQVVMVRVGDRQKAIEAAREIGGVADKKRVFVKADEAVVRSIIEKHPAYIYDNDEPVGTTADYRMFDKDEVAGYQKWLDENGKRDSVANRMYYASKEGEDKFIEQKHTSAGTSLEKNEPTLFKDGSFSLVGKPGKRSPLYNYLKNGEEVLDIGAGKTRFSEEALKRNGIGYTPLDPFNRAQDVNAATIDGIVNGKRYDAVTAANLLNVLESPELRSNIILQAAKALKPGGHAFFDCYKAPTAGERGAGGDNWQTAMAAKDYIPEIKRWFTNAVIAKGSNGIIIATMPKKEVATAKAQWTDADMNNGGRLTRYFDKGEVIGESKTYSSEVEETNRKFDKELQDQIDGSIKSDHVYNLGKPSDILRSTGIPSLPIQLTAKRLAYKSGADHHPFDIKEMKGLVKSIQEPVAVFAYGDKNKAQNLIVDVQHEGKNFVVGMSIRPTVNGSVLDINSIRTIYPKNNHEWMNWINQGKLLYVNKEKIQVLFGQHQTNPGDVPYFDLDSARSIAQNFVNPQVEKIANSTKDGTVVQNDSGGEAPLPQQSESKDSGDRRFDIGEVGADRINVRRREDAIRMEGAGADRRKIWEQTGWWKGKDGKWRFEINSVGKDDFDAILDFVKNSGKFYDGAKGTTSINSYAFTLKDLERAMKIDGKRLPTSLKSLVAAYPKLANERIVFDYRTPKTPDELATLGYASGKEVRLYAGGMSHDTFNHELQHKIQEYEGMARGTNTSQKSFDRYQQEHGEWEARVTTARANMTPEERRRVAPWETAESGGVGEADTQIDAYNQARIRPDGVKPPEVKPSPTNDGKPSLWDRYHTNMTDRLQPILRMERDSGRSIKTIYEKGSPYNAFRLLPGHNEASRVRYERQWKKPYERMLKEHGITDDDVGRYMICVAAPERNAMVLAKNGKLDGAGLSDVEADNFIRDMRSRFSPEKMAAVEKAAQHLWDMQAEGLRRRLESGRIDDDAFDTWTKNEPHHVPMRTDMSEDGEVNYSTSQWKRHEFKGAEGRKTLADNPVEFMFKEYQEAMYGSNQNDARRALAEFIGAHPEYGTIRRGVRKGRTWSFTHGMEETVPDPYYFEQSVKGGPGKPNLVSFKKDGVLHMIELDGKRGESVAEAVTGRGVRRAPRIAEKAIRAYASTATELSPTFGLRNFVADYIESTFNTIADRGIVGGTVSNIKRVKDAFAMSPTVFSYTKTGKFQGKYADVMRKYVESGASIGGATTEGYDELRTEFRRIHDKGVKTTFRNVWNLIRGGLSLYNSQFEMANRLSVFKDSLDHGESLGTAAMKSREWTTDFNKYGNQRWTNSVWMFSNSVIQSTVRQVESLALGKHGAQTATALVALGIIEATMEHFCNESEDDGARKSGSPNMDTMTEFNRANSIYFRMGDRFVRIPFHAGPFSALKYMGNCVARACLGDMTWKGGSADVLKEVLDLVPHLLGAGDAGPDMVQTFAPTLAVPVLQVIENKDFAGRKIRKNMYSQTKPYSENGRENTSDLYKRIARWMNEATGGNRQRRGFVDVAPETIKHVVDTMLKNLGRDVGGVMETAYDVSGKGSTDVRNIPFARDFVRDVPDNTTLYYETKNRFDKDVADGSIRQGSKTWKASKDAIREIDTLRHWENGESMVDGHWKRTKNPSDKTKETLKAKRLKLQQRLIDIQRASEKRRGR